MLVILKIPIVYLCGVVWWAIRAEPGRSRAQGGPSSRSARCRPARAARAATGPAAAGRAARLAGARLPRAGLGPR